MKYREKQLKSRRHDAFAVLTILDDKSLLILLPQFKVCRKVEADIGHNPAICLLIDPWEMRLD